MVTRYLTSPIRENSVHGVEKEERTDLLNSHILLLLALELLPRCDCALNICGLVSN